MKLKNIFHALGLKSSVKFFGAERVVIGEYKNTPLSFYQWRTPKSSDVTLNLAEVDELKSFISEGDIAIDVGAHIGDSTLPIALACGSTGGVYAFEPNPIVFSILAKNALINKSLTNIYAIPFACSYKENSLDFGYSDAWLANGGDKSEFSWTHGHQYKVPVNGANPTIFIQDTDISKIRYLKIDVEGLEIEILKLFEKIIDLRAPYIKFEIAKFTSQSNRVELESFFKNRQYELRVVGKDGHLFGKNLVQEDFYRNYSLDVFCIPLAV